MGISSVGEKLVAAVNDGVKNSSNLQDGPDTRIKDFHIQNACAMCIGCVNPSACI